MLPPRLVQGIVAVVSLVWVVNFGLKFVIAGWEPDPAIHGIFMGVVGGALTLGRKTSKDTGGPDPPAPPDPPQPPAPPIQVSPRWQDPPTWPPASYRPPGPPPGYRPPPYPPPGGDRW